MSGTITRLLLQQKHRQRVNIYLDGVYAFALPDTEAARLKVGQHLSDDDISRLRHTDDEARAFDKAARLLASRPRAQAEIETQLRQAGFGPETIAQAIAHLQAQGYVDDASFVQWWIDNRGRFSPRSQAALRQELLQKGVDRSLIDQALAPLDALSQALAAARPRAERWRLLPQPEFYKKMVGFLQRRGFDYATARSVCDQLWQEQGHDRSDDLPPDDLL